MTHASLIKVGSIAEHSAILLICIKQIIGLEKQFSVFLEWPFYTGFTVLTDVSREATILDPNQTAPSYKIQETINFI